MKKLITLLAVAVVTAAAFAEEKNVTGFIGTGITVPVYRISVDDDGSRLITGALADINSFTVNRDTGLVATFDLGLGWGTTKDIPIYDESQKHGFLFDLEWSLGYAFINTNTTIFSLGGLLGFGGYSFSGREKIMYEDKTLSNSRVTEVCGEIGIEALFIRRINNILHFYAKTGFAYALGMEETSYYKEIDDIIYEVSFSRYTTGHFAVKPSIGLCWQLN